MTRSIEPPQRDRKAFEAKTISAADILDICLAIGVQCDNEESTGAGMSEATSGEESSIVQCAGKAKDRGTMSDDEKTENPDTVSQGPFSSTAQPVVPTKAPPRTCVKLRFQPYPCIRWQGSAVSTQPGDILCRRKWCRG